MNFSKEFTWESSVRGYELDNQSIVNNANYLHYFNHARLLCLKSMDIDWDDWHKKGYDLVLIKVSLEFKAPLKAFDKYRIISSFNMKSKLKIAFEQKLYKLPGNSICAVSNTLSTCIATKNGKPIYNDELFKKMSVYTEQNLDLQI